MADSCVRSIDVIVACIIVEAVFKVTHGHAGQNVLNFVPIWSAKLIPGVVLIDFHRTKGRDHLCFKT